MDSQMVAYQCVKCGELHHPVHYVCRKCGAREFEAVPLEGEVTLVTFTRVYNLPEGYMKPYLAFGIAQFSNGLCVSGQLDAEQLEIGMKLQAAVGVVKEGIGRDYYGFIFKPTE